MISINTKDVEISEYKSSRHDFIFKIALLSGPLSVGILGTDYTQLVLWVSQPSFYGPMLYFTSISRHLLA